MRPQEISLPQKMDDVHRSLKKKIEPPSPARGFFSLAGGDLFIPARGRFRYRHPSDLFIFGAPIGDFMGGRVDLSDLDGESFLLRVAHPQRSTKYVRLSKN